MPKKRIIVFLFFGVLALGISLFLFWYLAYYSSRSQALAEKIPATVVIDSSEKKTVSPDIWGVSIDSKYENDLPDRRYIDILRTNIDAIKKIGVKTIRFPGNCNANLYDISGAGFDTPQYRYVDPVTKQVISTPAISLLDIVNFAREIGAKIIFQANLDVWLQDNGCPLKSAVYSQIVDPMERAKALRDDLAKVVRRFREDIAYVELGSEQWAGQINPDDYLRVAKSFAAAVKEIDSEMKTVIVGYPSIDYLRDIGPDENLERTVWTTAVKNYLQSPENRCGDRVCFDYVSDKLFFRGGYSPPAKQINPITRKYQYLRENYLASDGTKIFYRSCPISGDTEKGGIQFSLCSAWKTEILKEPASGLWFFGPINPEVNNSVYRFLTPIADSKKAESQLCRINPDASPSGNLELSNCSMSSGASLNQSIQKVLPSGNQDPESYKLVKTIAYQYQNTVIGVQVKVSDNGKKVWQRFCQIDISNQEPQLKDCSSWQERDVVQIAQKKKSKNLTVGDYDAVVFKKGNDQYIFEWLTDKDSKQLYLRSCPIIKDAPTKEQTINFALCDFWQKEILASPVENSVVRSSFVVNITQEIMPLPYNFPGVNAYLPDVNLPILLKERKEDYIGAVPVVSSWNLACNKDVFVSYSRDTIEHAHYVFDSLLRYAENDIRLTSFSQFLEKECGLFKTISATAKEIDIKGQAFELTSLLADGEVYKTTTLVSSRTLPKNPSCVGKECLLGDEIVKLVSASAGRSRDNEDIHYIFVANKSADKIATIDFDISRLEAAEIKNYKTVKILAPVGSANFAGDRFVERTVSVGKGARLDLEPAALARVKVSYCPPGQKPVSVKPCDETPVYRSYNIKEALGSIVDLSLDKDYIKKGWINGKKNASSTNARFRFKVDNLSCTGSFAAPGEKTYKLAGNKNYFDIGAKIKSYKNKVIRITKENGADFGADKKLYLCITP